MNETTQDGQIVPGLGPTDDDNNPPDKEAAVSSQSNSQLVERNIKQIQIKEVSTVEKVIKTREVKQFTPTGDSVDNSGITVEGGTSYSNNITNDRENPPAEFYSHSNSNNQISATEQLHDVLPKQMSHNFIENSYVTSINNAYQNLQPTTDDVNDIHSVDQALHTSNNAPPMPPLRRSSSKMAQSLPQSGYDELDSTLNYTTAGQMPINLNQQGVNINSLYSYVSKPNPVMITCQTPIDPNQMRPLQTQNIHDIDPYNPYGRIPGNDLGYLDQRSTYDTAYGTTNSMQPTIVQGVVPLVPDNINIYNNSIEKPEPLYSIRSNNFLPIQAGLSQPISVERLSTGDGSTSEIRWRDPDLNEVINFLSNPNPIIRANAAAYLQHISYMDDQIKQQTRLLGGIPILIKLLDRDIPEVQRNACGALRNLSYGRQNDENKRTIRESSGVQTLVRALINTHDSDVRELVTGVLWNLSSCEEIKWSIIDDALSAIVNVIIVPHTSWCRSNMNCHQHDLIPSANETYWSTVFRNASGILRNISSAGAHARKQLRECEGLVESLLIIIKASITKKDVENKLVENCVCILRNLSYRCQEVEDHYYDKNSFQNNSHNNSTNNSLENSPSSPSSSGNLTTSLVGHISSKVGDNFACFGRKSKSKSNSLSAVAGSSNITNEQTSTSNSTSSTLPLNGENKSLLPPHHPLNLNRNSSIKRTNTQTISQPAQYYSNSDNSTLRKGDSDVAPSGKELLWQPDIVKPYLILLQECSNSETLEAAAGAIQNLTACYWQPSVEVRVAVRKERGLPILVELLRMDKDRVVCAVATALRNLAIDERNKELIGKYAMDDLIRKLPNGDNQADLASDETIAAVLATLNEVISKNVDFARSLFEAGGLERLTFITKNRANFSIRVQRFASQVSIPSKKRITIFKEFRILRINVFFHYQHTHRFC